MHHPRNPKMGFHGWDEILQGTPPLSPTDFFFLPILSLLILFLAPTITKCGCSSLILVH
jgi:hypothetical protein